MNPMVVVIIEHTKRVRDGVHHRLGYLLPGLVTAQHAAAVRSEVKVDKGFHCQISCR